MSEAMQAYRVEIRTGSKVNSEWLKEIVKSILEEELSKLPEIPRPIMVSVEYEGGYSHV